MSETNTDWMVDAACRDEDSEKFFPLGETGPQNEAQIAEAKSVCFRCTVAASCLDWAFISRSNDGIFGGLTADERRLVRSRWLAFQTTVDQTAVAV